MLKVAGGQYITRPGRPASTGRTLTAKQEREVQRLSKSTYSARSLRGRTFPSLRGIGMVCFGQLWTTSPKKKPRRVYGTGLLWAGLGHFWRRGWDSNPR